MEEEKGCLFASSDLESKTRKELQALAKEHGLKANGSSDAIIAALLGLTSQSVAEVGDAEKEEVVAVAEEVKPVPRGRAKRAAAEPVEVVESKRTRREVAPAPAPAKKAAPKSKATKVKAPVVVEEEDEECTVILCDRCDGEFEMDVVGLTKVPKGDWFCTKCEAKNLKDAAAAAKKAPVKATRSRK